MSQHGPLEARDPAPVPVTVVPDPEVPERLQASSVSAEWAHRLAAEAEHGLAAKVLALPTVQRRAIYHELVSSIRLTLKEGKRSHRVAGLKDVEWALTGAMDTIRASGRR